MKHSAKRISIRVYVHCDLEYPKQLTSCSLNKDLEKINEILLLIIKNIWTFLLHVQSKVTEETVYACKFINVIKLPSKI